MSGWLLLALSGCDRCGGGADSAPDVVIPDSGIPQEEEDSLSMPSEPTLDLANFTSAETCKECHPTHYDEWSSSNHAYAMHDPVFRALVAVRQEDLGGEEDLFCTQCHSAIGTRSGDIVPGFSFSDLLDITNEGITCESCHRISAIERTHNAGHVLDETGPIRGPIADPDPSSFHSELVYSPIFEDSSLCGSCHDVIESSGLPLERPYAEWLTSPAAENGQQCQDCHMPSSTGLASTEGTTERTLHSHRFIGVDVPMDGFVDEERAAELRVAIQELLSSAASVELQLPESVIAGEQLDVVVNVYNDIPAHNFPTGSTFIRQAWLEVIATDALGQQLYATGDLDDNGDLRDHWSELDPYGDDDLVSFSSRFIDSSGAPTLFSHRAAEHITSAIAPLYSRTYTLFVPTEAAAEGPISVTARLRFRSLPPHLLRKLDQERLLDELIIYDIDAASGLVILTTEE